MDLPFNRARRRTLAVASAAVAVLVAALIVGLVPTQAQAQPPNFKELPLPGACNSVSLKMAEAIDAQIKAAGGKNFVIRQDEPKKGEKGYVDVAVVAALTFFGESLGKKIEDVTADDIAAPKNAAKLKAAIDKALGIRKPATWKDGAGATVSMWCLFSGNGHGGPDLGLLLVPPGGKPADGTWIGGCLLDGGLNKYWFKVDANGDFDGFFWYNVGPDANVKDGYIRYTFDYDPKKDILKITKEYGTKDQNGTFVADPKKTEVEKTPGKPPKDFKDLKLNGKQISMSDGGCACPVQPIVVAVADPAKFPVPCCGYRPRWTT